MDPKSIHTLGFGLVTLAIFVISVPNFYDFVDKYSIAVRGRNCMTVDKVACYKFTENCPLLSIHTQVIVRIS